MNSELSRPANQRVRSGIKTSRLWEHIQIDIAPVDLVDGECSIYDLREWGVGIFGTIVDGMIVDFSATTSSELPIQQTLPPFDVTSEMYGQYRHSLVYRSWQIPSLGLTVHVESWVEKGRGGFVDLFTRKAESE